MEADGSPETLAPAANPKHAAMIERLSNLHQRRSDATAARRSESTAASPSFESVQSFLDRFAQSKHSIESALSRSRAADPKSNPDIKPQLDAISASIAELDHLVAENSYFLPSYEVRSSLKTLDELKDSLDLATAELLPRKKFSFKNRPAKKAPPAPAKEEAVTATATADTERSRLSAVRDSPGFRNREKAVLVRRFLASEEGNGEFTLADLTSCDVYLKGRIRALFVHRLRDCRVYIGPVLGSVLIEDTERCLFMMASHQIRIHHARVTDFYLRVRSRPIIEDSSGVRFAPYRLFYEGIEKELGDSGLGEETGNWGNVDDFKWLRAVQSPNWCVMPEEDRVEIVDVSDLDEGCEEEQIIQAQLQGMYGLNRSVTA